MKKEYMQPTAEITVFEAKDIITLSEGSDGTNNNFSRSIGSIFEGLGGVSGIDEE